LSSESENVNKTIKKSFSDKVLEFIFHTDLTELLNNTKIQVDLPEIVAVLLLWRQKAIMLRILHVSLGVTATFFSLLTAILISSDDQNSKYFAFIAALSVSLLSAFDLGTKSNNITNAYRELNLAAIRYNRGLINDIEVIKSYEEGERLIGNVTFQSTK
jgi:hypothetical protein